MRIILSLLFILLTASPTLSQEQTWIDLSNDYIRVSLDPVTGRYVIYDPVNYHPDANIAVTATNAAIIPTQAASPADQEFSPILGKAGANYNLAVFDIDGEHVVFGSDRGSWKGRPFIQNNSIIYNWQVGSLLIAQTLAIVTNKDTGFPDAVQISYDIQNTNATQNRRVGVKLILDPLVGDGQTTPFLLNGQRKIQREFSAGRGSMPDFWIQVDQNGNLSPLAIKGFLRGTGLVEPDKFILTTVDNAIRNDWKFNYSRFNSISKKNNAVILEYDPVPVYNQTTRRLASTIVGIPSLVNSFQNNGLEARVSALNSQDYTPLNISIWISNTTLTQFDNVRLTLMAPPELEVYDSYTKELYNIGNQDGAYPVSWLVGTENPQGGTFEASVSIQGLINGTLHSQFIVPLTVAISPEYQQNNLKSLADTRTQVLQKTTAEKVIPKIKTNSIELAPFAPEDTHGAAVKNLTDLSDHLTTVNPVAYQQVIQMINSELQLFQELHETEQSIAKIDTQIQILTEVYQRLYQDNKIMDQEQVNIQGLIDNINTLEQSLIEQEALFSNPVK